VDKLKQQLAQQIAAAKAALEKGDLDEATKHREAAEQTQKAIEEWTKLNGMTPAPADPMRPMLPGSAGKVLPVLPGNPEPDAQKTADPNTSAAKAVYATRFGDTPGAVKAILSDLYGSEQNAIDLYWMQKTAFVKYLRYGDAELDREERKALKTLVFTPEAIKAAMAQGVDDVKTLKTTMVEAVDTLGGYTVPVDFQANVIERLPGFTVVRPHALRISTSSNAVEMPKATGGDSQYTTAVRETWVDETPTATQAETNLTFGMERVDINTAMATAPLSKNLAEDNAFDIGAYLAEKFAEAAAINEDNTFLTGIGNGRPEGILPGSVNGLSLTAITSSQSATIEWDDIVDLIGAPDSQYRNNMIFIMEKATATHLAKQKDGQGQYLWRERFGDNVSARSQQLMGFPVEEQEAMPSLASSAYVAIFGDLRGYLIADRVGMSVQRYDDSTTASTNTFKYVMRRRLGGQTIEPWRFAVLRCGA